MAGDWIKMRAALMQSPKLIGMARALHRNRDFREWLTPGGSGPLNGQTVSDEALRCVTCALLLRVWSAAREFGKFDGDDLVLPHLDIPDLDLMAGCPGVGKAMASVAWASVKAADPSAVVLPKFRQHNAPMTPAEKQSAYRKRKSVTDTSDPEIDNGGENVTKALPYCGNKTVTRVEKSREDNKKHTHRAREPDENWLQDAVVAFLERWNNTPGTRRCPDQFTVGRRDLLIERFGNPAWVSAWPSALDKFPLKAFSDPVSVTQFMGEDFVRKVLAGQYDFDPTKQRGRRVASADDRPGIDIASIDLGRDDDGF